MPPTAISEYFFFLSLAVWWILIGVVVPAYEPMFDMPDMKAFGKAVIGLTYSYWPRDDVDVLSTIRDEEIVDLTISQPEFHDLSSLQPGESIRNCHE